MTTSAAPGPVSVYTGRVTNWPTVLASGVALLPLLVLGRPQEASTWAVVVPLLLAALGLALYALTGSSVRTTAGPNGVTVRFGVIGWPRCTYRIEQIERAEVVDLSAWWVAGGFWWTPRRTCATVRSGPSLRLSLSNGRTVTVSAPDPHGAVAAVEQAGTGAVGGGV